MVRRAYAGKCHPSNSWHGGSDYSAGGGGGHQFLRGPALAHSAISHPEIRLPVL
jgi:hypothetical protein